MRADSDGRALAMRRVVIVGASLAGLRTAEALRQAGFTGELTIVGDETHAPYNRPPLTKAALVHGPDPKTLALPTARDVGARWMLGVSATALDLSRREVSLDTGERLPFHGVVIATGASARRLPGGNVGVHHIRTVDDAAALHEALARPEQRVLVIGAGFLGSEVASTSAALGHRVTLVEASAGPMLAALGPALSSYCAGVHRDRGVDLRSKTTVLRLSPPARSRSGLLGTFVALLADSEGGRSTVEADVVVVALGATPNTAWLRGSGLGTERGVATDAALTAQDASGVPAPGVVAVGDVALVPQPLLAGARRRVEHWASAVAHSRIAAETLLGRREQPAAVVPSFWTDQHGLKIRGVGLPGAGDTTTVVDGAMEDHRFIATSTCRGRLVGAVSVNDTQGLFRHRSELESLSSTPSRDDKDRIHDRRTA